MGQITSGIGLVSGIHSTSVPPVSQSEAILFSRGKPPARPAVTPTQRTSTR